MNKEARVFWRVVRGKVSCDCWLSCERVDAGAGGQIGLQMLRLRGTSAWILC